MDKTNYEKTRNILTGEQIQIREEFIKIYNLDASQISFEGDKPEPILDYEALNVLRLRLTDIQTTEPEVAERNMEIGIVTIKCTAVLPDGRSASDLGSAQFPVTDVERNQLTLGELMPDGSRIQTIIQAQNVALARALRRAIRAVGINLLKAHQQYLNNGEISIAEVDPELQSQIGREIHKLAAEWGHIKSGDKTKYQEFIQGVFGKGKRSTLDLNDIEKSQLATMYRTLINSRDSAWNDGQNYKKAA